MKASQIKIFWRVISVVGFGLFALALSADYWGGNPGMSAPQLLVIIVGLLIGIAALALSFEIIRNRIMRHARNFLLISVPIVFIVLLLIEFVLSARGFPLRYPPEVPANYFTKADWYVCDELGCRFEGITNSAYCIANASSRQCAVNQQGYHDADNFVADPSLDHYSRRILLLGDSFAFGATAAPWHSFADILDAGTPNAIVWDTGILGAGTNQEAALLDHYAPIMHANTVILAFFGNDFEDNVYPLDSYYFGLDPSGKRVAIRQYRLDSAGNVSPAKSPEELYYRLYGTEPPPNEIVHLIGRTRLGTILINAYYAVIEIRQNLDGRHWNVQVEATRHYLEEIANYTSAHNIELLVLMIPNRHDLTNPNQNYTVALDLFKDLNLTVLNPIHLLSDDDYGKPPDDHWNSAGHKLIGDLLVRCVNMLDAGQPSSDCVSLFNTGS